MPRKKKPAKLLSHRRHTGKVLHHRHTSYPLVVLLLLMVGVFMVQATRGVRADEVVVTATSNGPLPPSAAVILDPVNGQRFTGIPIPVSGTCPYPYVVKLYRNNLFSGSTQCNPDGTWLLFSDLFAGENELIARIFNFADQEGPQSTPVVVHYDVPVPPTSPAQPDNSPQQSPTGPGAPSDDLTPTEVEEKSKPFFITTDEYFRAIYVGQEITWDFGIVGGNMPFRVTVAWGDGGTTTMSGMDKRHFTVSHTYTKAPTSREYFPVTVSVSEEGDRNATLQVFTILNDRITPGLGRASSDGGSGGGIFSPFWRIAWPAYAVTLLMVISFWLGQRRGLIIFSRAPKSIQKFHRKHFYKPPRRHA